MRNARVSITLRRATLADVPLLEKWDDEPDVAFSTGAELEPDDWVWSKEVVRDVTWQEILIAEENARPIGVVQICDPHVEPTHYWGEIEPNLRAIDIWLGDPSDRNRGLGARVMKLAIDRCFAPPEVTAIVIDPLVANVRAIRFYERMGFRFIGERHFGPDHCHVMRLERLRR